ncbi:MAG: hypothetical protein IMF09_08245, partial [Proteobacteria bacterium]|nr:hypothetical protein [Pseudomonadota bacterium]
KELIWGDDFTFVITPPPANTPPVADAGLPQAVLVNDTVVLNGSSSSDVDDDPLSYRWSFESLPLGSYVELDTTDPIHPSFVTDMEGRYLLRLVVNDGLVDSIPDTVEIMAGCSGDVVTVSNSTIPPGITECVATTSITTGPNVLVVPGAELRLFAPNVSLENGVTVEVGGVLSITPNP